MKILNLGCGSKASPHPAVTNIDWSILLRIKINPLLRFFVPFILNDYRKARFNALPDNIMAHDLSKGIPFHDASVDVVYHSHMLEHLDRNVAEVFVREIFRVLKPGGVLRIVVPDFELVCRDYIASVDACARDENENLEHHDASIEPVLLASVRRESYGTSQQKPFRRFVENMLLGDARRRGDTHQWMYDRFNLTSLVRRCGFDKIVVQSFNTSLIPDWAEIGLDRNESGNEYKPGSVYIEAIKS